jgi:hypothetical protein
MRKKMREKIIKYLDNVLIDEFNVIHGTQEQFNLAWDINLADNLNDEEIFQLYQKVKKVFGNEKNNARNDF